MIALARLVFVVAFLAVTVLPIHAVDKEGLILLFTFDEADEDTVMDTTGNNHNGILKSGAAITNDLVKFGTGALQIEPQDAVMEVESFAELEEYQDNTYLLWLYFTAGSNGAWSQIVSKCVGAGGDVNTDRSPGLWSRPESLGLHYRYSPGNLGSTTLGPNGEGSFCEAEQWYHIAGVKKDAELTVYINGEEKGKYTVPEEHALGPGNLYFGKSPRYRASTFVMDDFVIYNRALTQAEIVEIMGGDLSTPVDAADKLASTWGNVKRLY